LLGQSIASLSVVGLPASDRRLPRTSAVVEPARLGLPRFGWRANARA
jgi:hypothetical protein